jgi:hypothetical protein
MGARRSKKRPVCAEQVLKCRFGLLREDTVAGTVATSNRVGEKSPVRLRDVWSVEANL